MRDSFGDYALARRLRLPGVRRNQGSSTAFAKSVPVRQLPPTDFANSRYYLRAHQAAVEYLVSRHVPPHSVKERGLGNGVDAQVGRELQHRLDAQAEAHASDARAGGSHDSDRSSGDR